MPFTKIFGTTSGAYSTATLWKPIDVTSPDYAWTASGSGTNEYYLRTAANGNPGFVAQPDNVYINGSNATEGTAGSLTAGQFDYADNDTLGYSTIYVRLSDGTDPDTKDPGYVKFYQTPRATEHVRFAADSASINSATGLDQSGVAIGDFVVEEGYAGTIGSATLGYLIIDPDRFEFAGAGLCYLNLHTAAIPITVHRTYQAPAGSRGLYLRGSGITVANIKGGQVGIAWNAGETATVTTVRSLGSGTSVWIGSGATLTNHHHYAGDALTRCAVAAVIQYGGSIVTEGTGATTALTTYGGNYVYNSTGTLGTHNWKGGNFDETQSGAARTITTRNVYLASGSIQRNKEAVTVTTEVFQESLTMTVSPTSSSGGGFL